MPAVGVVGESGKKIVKILLRMTGGKSNCYHITERQRIGPNVNILIAAEAAQMLPGLVSKLCKSDYLVVNADDRAIFPFISHSEAMLITYGFNAKACITASSVADDGVQVCIQREFMGLDGAQRLPQEFFAKAEEDADDVLAAAAAWAICGKGA